MADGAPMPGEEWREVRDGQGRLVSRELVLVGDGSHGNPYRFAGDDASPRAAEGRCRSCGRTNSATVPSCGGCGDVEWNREGKHP